MNSDYCIVYFYFCIHSCYTYLFLLFLLDCEKCSTAKEYVDYIITNISKSDKFTVNYNYTKMRCLVI